MAECRYSTKKPMNEPENDIKLVVFDVDGTLADYNSWPMLHELFGFSVEEDKRLYAEWKTGALTYKEWMDVIEVFYKTHPRSRLEIETLFSNIQLNDGVAEVVPLLSKKYRLAIISSGVGDYVEGIAKRLAITDVHAYCSLVYDDNGDFKTFQYHTDLTEKEAKVVAIKELCLKYNLTPNQIAFVGDSFNDSEAFAFTGRGIQYTDREPRLRPLSWKHIEHMTELLDIL